MDGLGRLTLFLQVAEAGSFVAAARRLGISASAVGKGIARLEERLGVTLFRRTTRSLSLTDEGLLFLERCRRILSEIEAVELELERRATTPRGRLRVALPLVHHLLLPALAAFNAAHPGIELHLDFSDRLVDLVEEGFDVAIRTGPLADSRLKSRLIGRFRLILVAAPDYLARNGMPAGPDDLADHLCLHHRFAQTGRLEPWPVPETVPLPESVVATTVEALLHLALAGRGITCLPDFTVAADLAAGRLVQVLPDKAVHQGVMQAVWPASRQASPRVRAFVDMLHDYLKT